MVANGLAIDPYRTWWGDEPHQVKALSGRPLEHAPSVPIETVKASIFLLP